MMKFILTVVWLILTLAAWSGPVTAQIANDVWKRPFAVPSSTERQEALAGTALAAAGIDELQVDIGHQPIPWWPGHRLYRFAGGWEPSNLFFYYVRKPDGSFIQLDGTSPPIHGINAARPPVLNAETLGPYVWFFNYFVRASEGPFLVTESPEDTFVPKQIDDKTRGVFAVTMSPMRCRMTRSPEAGHCDATILYSNALFRAEYAIEAGGMVRMLDDRPIAADLPVRLAVPVSIREAGAAFAPKEPVARGAAAVAPLRSRLETDLFEAVEALATGVTIRLNANNMPFMAGMAAAMMEQCNLPQSRATRARLAAFTATSSIGAMGGLNYGGNLGESVGSAFRQQSLLVAGSSAVSVLGCSPVWDDIGENLAKLLDANSAAGSGFVASCRSTHGEGACTCLANIGRQAIPDIAQRRYSSRLMRELIERNPFIALTIGVTCGVTNY